MLDLISLWKNVEKQTERPSATGNEIYPESTKSVALTFDRNTLQSSFEFDSSPDVKFVNNLSDFTLVNTYDALTQLELSLKEEEIRQLVLTEQRLNNPRFYDGEQMLIAGATYEKATNTVFFVAKKVPYSIIVCLNQKRFPESSALYDLTLFKTGVLAPLVTHDGQTFILQRTADTLFSVPGGFLEPQGDEKLLNLKETDNIVCATAKAEITEEIAGIKGNTPLRFEFSYPQISAISFRSSSTPIGTIEFIAPSFANCHSHFLQQIVKHNLAKDADEHTGMHEVVPLASSQRNALLSLLLSRSTKIPGPALFLPVLLSLTKLLNKTTSMIELPRQVPNSPSRAFPLRLFHPEIPKPMPKDESAENEQIQKTKL